jgi:hypothetical protein
MVSGLRGDITTGGFEGVDYRDFLERAHPGLPEQGEEVTLLD